MKACEKCGKELVRRSSDGFRYFLRRKFCDDACYRAFIVPRLEDQIAAEPNSGCFLWTGTVNEQGYGHARHNGRYVAAHRLAWILANGEIPDGMCVCHRCDTPSCCNPKHLFLGTKKDNAQDMIKKGRRAPSHGEHNGRAKLTDADVAFIREARAKDPKRWTQVRLAKKFNVSHALVHNVQYRKAWAKDSK